MKIYISTFYQVRFFTPNMLPVSTAMWDPKWYHDFNGSGFVFYDKRGIVNGYRYEPFNFPNHYWDELVKEHQECQKNCPFKDMAPECEFMKKYQEYLKTIDFNKMLKYFESVKENMPKIDTIVLLVHESPMCPCAERPILQQWFKDHGIELKEWDHKNSINEFMEERNE